MCRVYIAQLSLSETCHVDTPVRPCRRGRICRIGPVRAAEPPAVEVRLKSVDSLLARFEFFGGLAGKAEEAKQFAGIAKAFTNEKGLEGIDTTKDFGFYASVTQDNVVDSPAVLMVPIKDSEAFLNLFTGKLGITPKKGDDGSYSLDVPMSPKPIYFRFANGYAYATFGDAKHIAAAGLIAPEKFFAAKTDALLAATVHMERIPDEMKKVAFGQFELKMAEEKAKKNPNDTQAERMAKEFIMEGVVAGVKAALYEAKTASLSLYAEPKSERTGARVVGDSEVGNAAGEGVGRERGPAEFGRGSPQDGRPFELHRPQVGVTGRHAPRTRQAR